MIRNLALSNQSWLLYFACSVLLPPARHHSRRLTASIRHHHVSKSQRIGRVIGNHQCPHVMFWASEQGHVSSYVSVRNQIVFVSSRQLIQENSKSQKSSDKAAPPLRTINDAFIYAETLSQMTNMSTTYTIHPRVRV